LACNPLDGASIAKAVLAATPASGLAFQMIFEPDINASICILLRASLNPKPALIAFHCRIGVVQRSEFWD
jgi:hypothetical protein